MSKFLAIWHQRLRFFYLEWFTKLKQQDFETIKSEKTPVVLVAGTYASGRGLLPLKKFLESLGYPVYLAPAKRNFEPVPILAKKLQQQIQKIPAKRVQIIAHSLGGMTTLVALQDSKIFTKVVQVITLGSPLNGCLLGSLAFWERRNYQKYIALNSKTIRHLSSNPKINKKIRVFYACFDEIVFPKRNMCLKYAKENVELSVYGHMGLVLGKDVWKEIAKRLV
jgi:triacylglycerol lipase